jgi:Mg-chelatase subunit ChlD
VPPQVPPTDGTDRCAVMVDKAAQPRRVHRGERVEVVLNVSGACAGEHVTSTLSVDLVIAIDTSGSMSGQKLIDTRRAVMNLMLELDPSSTRVGLVTFDTEATTGRALTYGTDGLSDILQGLTAGGGTSIVAGYEAAYEMIRAAEVRQDAHRIIVFMSDGYGDEVGLGELLRAAAREGVTTITVGFGDSPAQELLKRMASDPSYYYEGREGPDLDLLYEALGKRIAREHLLAEGTIEDTLPANMAYISGSGWPSEPAVSSDGGTLTWQLAQVLEPGMVLGYSVRPMEVGIWPTNEIAELTYVDGAGHADTRVFPVPEVEVLHERLFLPVLVNDDCDDSRLHLALVIDTSSSMRAPLEPGAPPKIDEALQAARRWVDSANLERDVMTLVTFNHQATHLATSSEPGRLHAALDAVVTEEGTRIDLGLREARGAILRQRAWGDDSLEVVVMLSDGVPAVGPVTPLCWLPRSYCPSGWRCTPCRSARMPIAICCS